MFKARKTKTLPRLVVLATVATVALQLVSTSVVFAATRVFSDGFDSGSTSQWQSADGRNRCVPVQAAHDSGSTQSGAYMLECNWNGVAAWNAADAFSTLELSSWPYSNEFFVRLWVRLDTDVDNTNGAKWMRFYNMPHNSYIMQRDGGNHSELEWVEGVANPPGAGKWDVGNLNNRQWQKYEWYWNIAPSGVSAMHIWVNDVLTHSYTGWSGDPAHKWYPLVLTSNWSNNPGWEHDATNHLYFDSIEIYSDSTSGNVASGSMLDGTIALGSGSQPPTPSPTTSPPPPTPAPAGSSSTPSTTTKKTTSSQPLAQTPAAQTPQAKSEDKGTMSLPSAPASPSEQETKNDAKTSHNPLIPLLSVVSIAVLGGVGLFAFRKYLSRHLRQ